MTETQRERVLRWFRQSPTWVGVFENKDITSPNIGHKVAVPFDGSEFEAARIGVDRGPELLRKYGSIPEQYILIAKCLNAEDVFTHIEADRNAPEAPE